MQNGFINCFGHELTQSGKYDLDLLAHHPISREEKWREMFPLVMEMLPVIFLLDLSPPGQKLIHSLWITILRISISNLTPMIISVWLSYKPRIDTSTCFSGTPSTWRTYSSYLMWTKWIRGSPQMHLGENACLVSLTILSHISL